MRIGTYNVLGLTGYPPKDSVQTLGNPLSETTAAHFKDVFQDLGCDILALQEGVTPDQIRRIANAMNCHAATIPSPIAWPGHVISRYPVKESRAFSHVSPYAEDRPFSRTAGAALLQVADDRMIWIVDVHLHPGRIELRNEEADILAVRTAELLDTGHPVVVLGDFNCEIGERLHQVLAHAGFANAMSAVGGGVKLTIDTAGIEGRWKIDHIYVSSILADRLKHAEVVRREGYRQDSPLLPGKWVHSDHLPVIVDLEYP